MDTVTATGRWNRIGACPIPAIYLDKVKTQT
jgi:hypothetical protein